MNVCREPNLGHYVCRTSRVSVTRHVAPRASLPVSFHLILPAAGRLASGGMKCASVLLLISELFRPIILELHQIRIKTWQEKVPGDELHILGMLGAKYHHVRDGSQHCTPDGLSKLATVEELARILVCQNPPQTKSARLCEDISDGGRDHCLKLVNEHGGGPEALAFPPLLSSQPEV